MKTLPHLLALAALAGAAAFAGFALAEGWEDLFFPGAATPAELSRNLRRFWSCMPVSW